jgi:hypothetical protein
MIQINTSRSIRIVGTVKVKPATIEKINMQVSFATPPFLPVSTKVQYKPLADEVYHPP